MKAKIFLVVSVLAGILIIPWLYEQGQSKYSYDLHPVDKFVPIPNIFDNYTGTAILEDDTVKANWTYVLTPGDEHQVFTCLGWIETPKQPYYVLEFEGKLYLEKGEHIEPIIFALCALSRGGPANNHPDKIEEAIACLPDNREFMLQLVAKFKKPKVVSP